MAVNSSPAKRSINGLDGLHRLVGEEIGVSDWLTVDQEMIDRFAEATGDHQWIHVDGERVRADSPYKTTVAHGHLVLSLGARFAFEVFAVEGVSLALNYGLERVRFPAPLPSGSRLRMRVALDRLQETSPGTRAGFTYTFEAEGQAKPVCVAQALGLSIE